MMLSHSKCHVLLSALALVAATALTGCGLGTAATSLEPAPQALPRISGKALGGSIPIKHSRLFLYATGAASTPGASDGYGVGHFIEEANPVYEVDGNTYSGDTDGGGNFSFNAAGYTCPASENLYIVGSGGNTADGDGASGFNTGALLVVAIGSCGTLAADGNFVYMNELTTVAAGYALGHFMSITTDSATSPVVYQTVTNKDGTAAPVGYNYSTSNATNYVYPWVVGIGATITNGAPYGCTTLANCDATYEGYISAANTAILAANPAAATISTAPLASGLTHAFTNANDLAPFYLNEGANASLPRNSAALVPRPLVNTLADVMAACTNGGYSSSPCKTLYQATGLETTGSTPVISASANTLQSMVNLAATPILQNSITSATFISAFTAASAFFQPFLTAGPADNDWSIAIDYPKGMGAVSGFQGLNYVYSGGLDINDVYYVANDKGNQTTPSNLISIGSDGTLLGYTPDQTTYVYQGVAPDALGNVYCGNNNVSSAVGQTGVLRFAVSGGTVSSTTAITTGTAAFGSSNNPYSLAVDRNNNIWLGTSSATLNDVWEATAGSTTLNVFANYTTKVYGVSVDPDQNIWVDNYTNGGAIVVQNTAATGATPTYSSSSTKTASGGLLPYNFMFVAHNSTTEPYDAYTGLYTKAAGIEKYTPTVTAPEVTAVSAASYQAVGTTSTLEYGASDGLGQLYIADIASPYALFVSKAGGAFEINPCLPASGTGNTTCGSAFASARGAVVDSAGSVYVTGSAGGNVVEFVGLASPTWPLLSLGMLGRP